MYNIKSYKYMKIIQLPKLSQTYEWDCGANAIQSVLVYYGIEERGEIFIKHAKTLEEHGTDIKDLTKTIKKFGLDLDCRVMTIKDLKKYIDKNIPIIILLQAWSSKKNIDWKNSWNNGHYVVAIGYTKEKIIFEDPYSFHRTYLKNEELEDRWHDMDRKGKKYLHYGVAVYGRKPSFDRNKIIHMD